MTIKTYSKTQISNKESKVWTDLLLRIGPKEDLCAVDVSFVHPAIPSAPSAEAALRAESRKRNRYHEQCSLVGVKLVPFIVTTFGTLVWS